MSEKKKISAQDQVGGKVNAGVMDAVVGLGESADYVLGSDKVGLAGNYHVIDETVHPDEIDLSSFKIQKSLNPKIWKKGKLDSRIRIVLLNIADKFMEYLDVDDFEYEDIIMTGSLCNFNWDEKYSDIDIHVLVDFNNFDEDKELLKKYFNAKRRLWNDEHKNLSIFGYPVELYVQDVEEPHVAAGIYSLERNKWISHPVREKLSNAIVNKEFIKERVADYMNEIDKIEYSLKKEKDNYKISKLGERAKSLFDKIKKERSIGFKTSESDEMNSFNIVFKSLRRNDYIGKLKSMIQYVEDHINSISI